MQETVCLLVLLGMVSGGDCLQLNQFPANCIVRENVPPGTRVYSFNVTLSPSASPVSFGFPFIVNSNPLSQAFRINGLSEKSFEVVTTGKPPLDFETMTMPKRFELQVYVKDEAGAMDVGLLTVQLEDVNEPPLFLDNMAKGTVELYVLEGTSPGTIYQMEAVDPENKPLKEPLLFSLTSPSKYFNVSTNGILFSTTTFDFEAGHNRYVIDVEVVDSGELKATRTFLVNIINVNDESPYFTSSVRVYTIPEELSPETIVASITAKDPDDGDSMGRLLYELTTPNEYFIINQLTGTIQIASRLNRDAGKLKQNPKILLEVLVKDRPKGGQENRTQITFIIEDINDNPSACNSFTFSFSVRERIKKMLLLDLVEHCFDNDAEAPNNQFSFTDLSGVGSIGKFFQDSSGSGKIWLIGDLDYEDSNNLATGNKYALTIQVQDTAAPYYKSTIYIYIQTIPENEHPLHFDNASYVFEVLELKSVQSRIGQVHARDEDYPQSDITYSILTGGSTVQYMGLFWINPKTGVLQLVTEADFESDPQHVLTVQATNKEESSTATVTVNILDENDEKPTCEPNFYFLTIPVDLRVGTNIRNFKLTCTDKDSSPRSFRYFVGEGNKNNHFAFSPNAGSNITSLLLATPFDYSSGFDKAWDYKLLIYITDDNLLTSRKKAEAFVQTGTVTLNIRVVPRPTTAITTTSTPRITYLIQRKNVYSSSAWYVPFIITVGSMLLLGLLGYQFFLLVKFIRRYCSFKTKEDKESSVKKGETKKAKREVVLEMTKINTVFDGEALDPVTGKIYEFNSKSGARRWKNPSLHIWSEEKDLSEQGAVWTVANDGEGMNPLEGTNKGVEGKTRKMEADDISVGFKSDEGKMESSQSLGTPRVQKSREGIMGQGSSPVLLGRASPKIYPHSPVKTTGK
ncbi:cadherin-related family member 3 [Trichosurus vulpecula]|uniref:cadherin-related family member 3 n=1 Tax=Trichosurus vulpecula TaxID=9337 RepID=UPI00186AF4F5|nr:cadherin-related family member 3 [Trichosurus vulpecula]